MKTLARGLVLVWSVMSPLGAPAHAAPESDPALDALAAAPEIGSYEVGPIGVPRKTGKISLTVTVIENGKPKTSPVTIASGVIQPYTSPNFDPLDSTDVRADKIAEQRGMFSQMKAQVIADAIVKQTGIKAQAAVLPQEQTIIVGAIPTVRTVFMGSVIIPNVAENQGNPIAVKEQGVLGEGRNGGRYIKPGAPSPGSKASLERMTPGIVTVATGLATALDPDGGSPEEPSSVQFGLEGIYVAEVFPTSGMTDALVLQLLKALLDAHDLAATFDPILVALTFDDPIPDGTRVVWGNTDPGLDFTFAVDGLAPPISTPGPAAIVLLAVGFLSVAAWSAARVTMTSASRRTSWAARDARHAYLSSQTSCIRPQL